MTTSYSKKTMLDKLNKLSKLYADAENGRLEALRKIIELEERIRHLELTLAHQGSFIGMYDE